MDSDSWVRTRSDSQVDSDSWIKKKVGLFRGPGLLDPNRVGLSGGLGLLGPNRIGLLLGLGLLDPRPVGLWFGLGLLVCSGLEIRGRASPPLSRHWAWERATSPTRGEGQEKLTAFTPLAANYSDVLQYLGAKNESPCSACKHLRWAFHLRAMLPFKHAVG